MHTNHRTISRVLAAAVASSGFAVAPMPTLAASLTCTSSTFTATASGGNIVVNCTSPSTGASCSLTASPTTVPSSGGTVTLTASSCGTVSSVMKSGSTQIGTSGTSWTDTLGANTGSGSLSFTYTVQGSSGSDSVVVTQNGTGTTSPPPTSGSWDGTCPGYATVIQKAFSFNGQKVSTTGFNNNAIVVAYFTTPDTPAVSGSAVISVSETVGPTLRSGSLSTVPCDMSGTGLVRVDKSGTFTGRGSTVTPTVFYQINGTPVSGRVVLKPKTTYYLNVVNRNSSGAPSCTSSSCDIFVQLTTPNGF